MSAATEEKKVGPPRASEAPMGGRMGTAGMPAEKSEDFRGSTRRLLGTMAPERTGASIVLFAAVASVVLSVIGPKILGHATDIIIEGILPVFDGGSASIDSTALRNTLLTAVGLYAVSAALSFLQSFVLAGVVQRTMNRLRAEVEEKLHRLSLAYVDSQPRGDLLSRVTNDIDNLAHSLQQTLSQLVTSTLTIVGVISMMFWISWQLALLALIIIPVSMVLVKQVTKRAKTRFIAQWTHTGTLNAQVEEAFTGHSLVKVFGQQKAT